MSNITEWELKRKTLLNECQNMLDKAGTEKRKFTAEEAKEYDQKIREVDLLALKIQAGNDLGGYVPGSAYRASVPGDYFTPAPAEGEIRAYNKAQIPEFVREIRAKNPLPDGIRQEELSLGRAIRAMVTGDWTKADAEKRVMAIGGSGGYLVPTPMAINIIGMALNQMAVLQAGAVYTEMESQTLKMPKVLALPTPEWLGENEAATPADITFDKVDLSAKKMVAIIQGSMELFEDAPGIDRNVEDLLAKVIALEFDRCALVGAGESEPIGVVSTEDIQTVDNLGETLTSYAPFTAAWRSLEEANEAATGLIMPPTLFGILDGLTDTTDQPLRPPESWASYKKFSSNQIPIAYDATMAILGNWRQLLWAVRSMFHLEITRDTTDAFLKSQVWVKATLRGDVGICRPAAFCMIENISTIPVGS